MLLSWSILLILLGVLWYLIYFETLNKENLDGGIFLYLFAVLPSFLILFLLYLNNNLYKLNYPVLINAENVKRHYYNARIFLTVTGYFLVLFFLTLFLGETNRILFYQNESMIFLILLFVLFKMNLVWFVYKSFQK